MNVAQTSIGISEIVLVVADVLASARFYRDVVGLEPLGEPDDEWAWFWAGDVGQPQRIAVHRGELLHEEHSPHPPGERFGQVHFAFHVPRERLNAALENARDHGVELYGPTELDWMQATSYYFYDPDGNELEFWSPDPN